MEEVFDERYSSEVSVSRILDYFLLTDERPETVVEMLYAHMDDIDNIINYSDCHIKMVQSDFLLQLSSIGRERFFDIVSHEPFSVSVPLLSQIFYRRKEFDEILVERSIRMMRSIWEKTPLKHRYAGMDGNYGKMLDRMFISGRDAIYVAENVPTDSFAKLIPYLRNSIFEGRILQMDFYEALSPINRRVLIKNLKRATPYYAIRFVKQFLTYDVDTNEKYELFRTVKNGNMWGFYSSYLDESMKDTADELMKCESYAEYSIRSTLIGLDASREMIFNLLFMTNLSVLFEMAEVDREKLDGICRISELLDAIKDSMYNGKNPMPRRK